MSLQILNATLRTRHAHVVPLIRGCYSFAGLNRRELDTIARLEPKHGFTGLGWIKQLLWCAPNDVPPSRARDRVDPRMCAANADAAWFNARPRRRQARGMQAFVQVAEVRETR